MCKALDRRTGRVVALKRVPDALQTVDAARRVLREVVVLNRLDHPNIIKIFSIFHTPATPGARVLDPIRSPWCPCPIDMYMAFEYATGGDLYGLRGDAERGRGAIADAPAGERGEVPPRRGGVAQGHQVGEHPLRAEQARRPRREGLRLWPRAGRRGRWER